MLGRALSVAPRVVRPVRAVTLGTKPSWNRALASRDWSTLTRDSIAFRFDAAGRHTPTLPSHRRTMSSSAASKGSTAKHGAGSGAGAGDEAKVGPDTKTFEFQPSLPRLPVPPLDQTLDTFLHMVSPLAKGDDMTRMKALVHTFRASDGPKLQAALEGHASGVTKVTWDSASPVNWLEEWWDRVAYLMGRDPLPVNINVFSTCHNATTYHDALERAAITAHSTAVIKTKIDSHTLPPDALGRDGSKPLCMHQYKRVFGVTRIPGVEEDRMEVHSGSRHVVVIRDGQFFALDVLHRDGSVVSVQDLLAQLRAIVAHADRLRDSGKLAHMPNIATLTYDSRANWARAREHLLTNEVNRKSLRTIERALWVMNLSRESPASHPDHVTLALHGNNEIWADKSMNLIFGANGRTAFNGEHGATDGSVVTRVMLECRKHEKLNPFDTTVRPSEGLELPTLLQWERDDTVDAALVSASASSEELSRDLDATCSVFEDFGKEQIKAMGLGPDSFVQMALQLAQYRDQGEFVATYESAITRLFMRGRTETIRPNCPASVDFVLAMDDASVSRDDKILKLKTAMKTHQAYVKRCMAGQAIDRHLLGLRLVAAGAGIDVPVFTDPLFARFNDFTLSTSQIAYPTIEFCGFGPPTPPAYGVCYNCSMPDKLITITTSMNSCEGKDSKRFTKCIEQAFRDIATLMLGDKAPRASKL